LISTKMPGRLQGQQHGRVRLAVDALSALLLGLPVRKNRKLPS
jgi:hypothetical protein